MSLGACSLVDAENPDPKLPFVWMFMKVLVDRLTKQQGHQPVLKLARRLF
jgi:hypothetical protein